MNNITVQYFQSLFPEFDCAGPATIENYINIATLRVPSRVWGAATRYATALLTAHMLTCQGFNNLGSGGGAVTSESVGDLSRSFGQVGMAGSGDNELQTTRYGIDFVALRRETVIGFQPTGDVAPPAYFGGWNGGYW